MWSIEINVGIKVIDYHNALMGQQTHDKLRKEKQAFWGLPQSDIYKKGSFLLDAMF